MKCYYEVLEIQNDAEDATIKTSYKRLALKWHPDKNIDNTEMAKEQFQLIQQAYEVLSDRQERAWYDAHREQILRGKDSDFQDVSLDVYQYFTSSCYEGYDDSTNSFYTVYRNVFEKIAQEELDFIRKEEFTSIPSFGMSTSDYDEIVGPFYSFWLSYNTKKSFVWLDEHSILGVSNRRILKLIDKENKKIRNKGRQERNEEIRALVNFVKKRDRRVQEHSKVLAAKIAKNRQKQIERGQRERLQRRRELEECQEQADWMKFDNVEKQLEELEKELTDHEDISNEHSDDGDELSCVLNLYCYACNKLFKTAKAFENHESSKKHKSNIEKLKKQVSINSGYKSDSSNESANEEIKSEDVDEYNISPLEKNESIKNLVEEVRNLNLEKDMPTEDVKTKRKSKKKKTLKAECTSETENFEPDNKEVLAETLEQLDSNDDDDKSLSKKQKRKKKKSNNKNLNLAKEGEANDEHAKQAKDVESQYTVKNGLRKKTEKYSKREPKTLTQNDIDLNHCCVTCKSDFPSKNKLFDHLKKTGHGVYLPQSKSSKNKKL